MNSAATSMGSPLRACSRQRRHMAPVASVIAAAIAAIRRWWKAGCDIRRSRRQAGPSVVTRPSPAATFVRS